jgi:phosphoribosylformylglycinamidine synthase subunit PurL
MAEAAGIGLTLEADDIAELFGEDQARYLVAAGFDQAEALMVGAAQAGVPLAVVGRFGGDTVRLGAEAATLGELSALYRGAFAAAVA